MSTWMRLWAPVLETLERGLGVTPEPENFPVFYSETTLDVIRSLGEAMFDEEDTAALDGFERRVDAFMSSWTGVLRPVAHALPWIFEFAPRLTGFSTKRLSALTVRERRVVLARMERSESLGLVGAYGTTKILFSTLYLEEPGLLDRLGVELGGMHPMSLAHVAGLEDAI